MYYSFLWPWTIPLLFKIKWTTFLLPFISLSDLLGLNKVALLSCSSYLRGREKGGTRCQFRHHLLICPRHLSSIPSLALIILDVFLMQRTANKRNNSLTPKQTGAVIQSFGPADDISPVKASYVFWIERKLLLKFCLDVKWKQVVFLTHDWLFLHREAGPSFLNYHILFPPLVCCLVVEFVSLSSKDIKDEWMKLWTQCCDWWNQKIKLFLAFFQLYFHLLPSDTNEPTMTSPSDSRTQNQTVLILLMTTKHQKKLM